MTMNWHSNSTTKCLKRKNDNAMMLQYQYLYGILSKDDNAVRKGIYSTNQTNLVANWTKPHPLPAGILTEAISPSCRKVCLRSSSVALGSKLPTKICNKKKIVSRNAQETNLQKTEVWLTYCGISNVTICWNHLDWCSVCGSWIKGCKKWKLSTMLSRNQLRVRVLHLNAKRVSSIRKSLTIKGLISG
jgi:hypothetical protein